MTDWCRTGDGFKIVVDVGPFEASDIEMKADEKQLTIRASHDQRHVGPGVFSRQFEGQISLPTGLVPNTLKATLSGGHLVVITGSAEPGSVSPTHYERIIPVFAVHDKIPHNPYHCGVGPGGP